jgi:serine/threonine protein kinase HipA of HipAB toxin-antitoxin module
MTEAIKVLGVDPGTTTGMSIVEFGAGAPFHLWHTELPWPEAAAEAMRQIEHLERFPGSVAVCEEYTLTARSAQRGQKGADDAMGMNGWIRGLCLFRDVDLAPSQKPAGKRSVTDDALKASGLWLRGRRHANDATRHALLYGMKKRLFDLKVLIPR